VSALGPEFEKNASPKLMYASTLNLKVIGMSEMLISRRNAISSPILSICRSKPFSHSLGRMQPFAAGKIRPKSADLPYK
jgi:hypothetical protein